MTTDRTEPVNLMASLPADLPQEQVLTLAQGTAMRIERIVSSGQASPPGFWYEQQENEWVLVLQGRGVIEYPDGTLVELRTGDSLHLPAGVRHRVRETSQHGPTVWLAVFWR
ncbi:MAG: cupin domain-containing protein [Desulfuromonadales bacterium]|nr:cupin domain-containing protein [Desulfuromonadales bacterium]